MKLKVNVNNLETVNELPNYWSTEDIRSLLKAFDFPEANELAAKELKEMLYMAITDYEPSEAAEILLQFKLSEVLNGGQIQNLSHEMAEERVAEQYAEPALHYDLFNINQLLFHAYNGKFPNTEATIIELTLDETALDSADATKEILIKAIHEGLKASCLVERLYEDQLSGAVAFGDVEKIIWAYSKTAPNTYEVLTSKYFIDKSDFTKIEYDAEIKFYEEGH
jgi:hypothetical protein